ncbi:hypothetical protein EON65_58600 [archaeon]|nr:MAG: hypothetical protein EON65_58600 [archaeon]
MARNKEELWSNVEVALEDMWSEDMTNKIQTLYESLPRRMETVIAAQQQWSWSSRGEKIIWGCHHFHFFVFICVL